MTVVLISSVKHFIGVSGDSKPTAEVPAGSTFYEGDTGNLYEYNGSAWVAKTMDVQLLAGTAVVGQVAIDQTIDNTTNKVRATQATHDNLNLNANLQVNNADNAVGNPAFTQLSNVEQTNGAAAAAKSVLVAGKVSTGEGVPIQVDADGKIVLSTTPNIGNIGGLAAHDAAASGNPVQAGGVYRVADPAVADGDIASFRVNAKGELLTTLTGSTASIGSINDKFQAIITRQTDFAGKVTGRTYDVPSSITYRYNAGLPSGLFIGAEYTQGRYDALVTDGTAANIFTTTNLAYAQMVIVFDVLTIARRTPGINSNTTAAELRTALKALTPGIIAWAVGADAGAPVNGLTIKIWNKTTSAFDAYTTNIATAITEAGASMAVAVTDFTNYIDDSGYLGLALYSTYPADGVRESAVNVDMAKLDIVLQGSFLADAGIINVFEQHLTPVTVTAGATTAAWSNQDISKCDGYVIAISPSATHTYSVAGQAVGRDNVELTASADRAALIASASQGKKMSARTVSTSPKLTTYITNGDAADKIYYGRLMRYGVKGGAAAQ